MFERTSKQPPSKTRELAVTAPDGRRYVLGWQRTCSCPPNHLNCLSPKEWIKAQLGVWQFYYEGRDIRDKKLHPATFPIALARRCIELFTHRGELVLDPFVGSGTTLVAAQDLQRNAIGFDLHPGYVAVSRARLAGLPREHLTHALEAADGEPESTADSPPFQRQRDLGQLDTDQRDGGAGPNQVAICDDARNIAQYLPEECVSLIVTSPPYANLLNRPRLNKSRRGKERFNEQYLQVEQYSQDPRDLGTLDEDAYAEAMGEIFGSLLPLLRPGAHCVVNVPDMWANNRRVTLHILVVEALREAGYELRNTIIWDRTNIVNRVGIFGWPSNYITMGTTFEYLLDFWRPARARGQRVLERARAACHVPSATEV